MKRSFLFCCVAGIVVLMLVSCGTPEEEVRTNQTYIHGKLTVEAELDTTADYSDIELLIARSGQSGELSDTLFYSVTNRDGEFSGVATFSERDIYPVIISRYENRIALANIILAENDTVHLEGELPNLAETIEIQSDENDLFQRYERLDSGLNRIFRFANAGVLTGDSLNIELRKWSNLYWDFYEEHKNTFASERAAMTSIGLLESVDGELMMQRLRNVVEENGRFVPFASRIGTRFYASNYDLDRALIYMDTLATHSPDDRISMNLHMNRIKLLYDSARVDDAKADLEQFKRRYSNDDQARNWIEEFEYDLTTLAPGSELPDYQFETADGQIISRDSMLGTAYILELTRLSNTLYQQQFDRSIAIHHIYKNYGIDFITVPLRATELMIDAFYEERARLWPVAQPGSFSEEELSNTFNINTIPTRILVDRNGNVVRKYEGTEFNDIISGLRQVLNNNEEEPS